MTAVCKDVREIRGKSVIYLTRCALHAVTKKRSRKGVEDRLVETGGGGRCGGWDTSISLSCSRLSLVILAYPFKP